LELEQVGHELVDLAAIELDRHRKIYHMSRANIATFAGFQYSGE
jgi:hypothetical protein